jgi:hypothetical protein
MRPPLGTVEKYTFKSTGMGMTTAGRTGSADPALNPAAAGSSGGGMSSHHGGGGMAPNNLPSPSSTSSHGMGGGNMASHHGGRSAAADTSLKGSLAGVQVDKRQMMSMKDAAWTHAMHVHLVVGLPLAHGLMVEANTVHRT